MTTSLTATNGLMLADSITLHRVNGTTITYTVKKQIAKTELSRIYEVKSLQTGEEAVAKLYLQEDPDSLEDLGRAERGAGREIDFLVKARENKRTDIPRINEFGLTPQGVMAIPIVIMEKIEGTTLEDVISAEGHNPTVEQALHLASSAGQTLKYAHEEAGVKPVINRDLKPLNIMVTPEGTYKVLDWAGGKAVGGHTEEHTQFMGSLYYTAPEVAEGGKVGTYTDVYSLGRVLQAYLLGKKDFETVAGNPTRTNFANKNMPAHMIDALLKATEEKQENRQQTIDELLAELRGEGSLAAVTKDDNKVGVIDKRNIIASYTINSAATGLCTTMALTLVANFLDMDLSMRLDSLSEVVAYALSLPAVFAAGGYLLGRRKIKRLESQASRHELEQAKHAFKGGFTVRVLPLPGSYPYPLSSLDTRTGALAELVPQFEEGSWLTSAELTKERITNKDLRSQWFYTANYGLYRVVDGKVRFAFGGREGNPIFKNVAEASRQLLSQEQNYVPQAEDIAAAVQQALVDVDMQDLQLQRYDDEFSYFWIDTKDYERTSDHVPAQRLVAEAVYGKGEDFNEAMHMLEEEGKIKKTRVYVLNPEYVLSKVGEGKAPAVARACRLYDSAINASFIAEVRSVNLRSRLRGVPQAERADAR